MATQKISMGRNRDTDYEAKKAAAIAQAGANDYVFGIQSVYQNGPGLATKSSRSPKFGNPNLVTGEMLVGDNGNFAPRQDAVGNQLLSDPLNTTGFVEGATSMTVNPQMDPEISGDMAAERMQMLAAGLQYGGLNNRQQIMGA